jgi:hypothetical protein
MHGMPLSSPLANKPWTRKHYKKCIVNSKVVYLDCLEIFSQENCLLGRCLLAAGAKQFGKGVFGFGQLLQIRRLPADSKQDMILR